MFTDWFLLRNVSVSQALTHCQVLCWIEGKLGLMDHWDVCKICRNRQTRRKKTECLDPHLRISSLPLPYMSLVVSRHGCFISVMNASVVVWCSGQETTIGTFRISLHDFMFGQLLCEIVSRLMSQKNIGELFCEISYDLFTISVVIQWWPVVEWQFSYKKSAKRVKHFHC